MVDRCVACGEVIPEGLMVCPLCEAKVNQGSRQSGSPLLWRWVHDISVVVNRRFLRRRNVRRDARSPVCCREERTR